MKPSLTPQDYEEAAKKLQCEPAAIRAVAEVESSQHGGFLPTDEPVILFERHVFRELTNKAFDGSWPYLSNRTPGGYGKVSQQHSRLAEAVKLSRDAALMSCSWGRFQIMGHHWKKLGYASLQEFINAMYRSEKDHLDAFVRFVQVNNLAQYLRAKRWDQFARFYNGKNYKINKYDSKMAAAYAKYK